MGKIAKGVNKINFTMLCGNYCYIIIENFPQKFSRCGKIENEKLQIYYYEVYEINKEFFFLNF